MAMPAGYRSLPAWTQLVSVILLLNANLMYVIVLSYPYYLSFRVKCSIYHTVIATKFPDTQPQSEPLNSKS